MKNIAFCYIGRINTWCVFHDDCKTHPNFFIWTIRIKEIETQILKLKWYHLLWNTLFIPHPSVEVLENNKSHPEPFKTTRNIPRFLYDFTHAIHY